MKYLFGIILLFAFLTIRAQEITITSVVVDGEVLPKAVKFPVKAANDQEAQLLLQNWQKSMQLKGYWEVSIDSISYIDSVLNAYVFVGSFYESIVLYHDLDKEILSNKNKQLLNNKSKLSILVLEQLEQSILDNYTNHGYPFAEVVLDSVLIEKQEVSAKVVVVKNKMVMFDTLAIHGDSPAKQIWLQQYLGIKEGDLFRQGSVVGIAQKLKQLPFLYESEPAQIEFVDDKAIVHVYLNKQKANQFDFILGLLPNSDLESRKLTITGDGTLHLLGAFGLGEEILVDFSQLRPKTQDVDIAFSIPYIHSFPIGAQGNFGLYKNDTLYFNLDAEAGLVYQFQGVNQIQAFFQHQSSNVLNYDTSAVLQSLTLPDEIDVRKNFYGVKTVFQNLNYPINPRNGYRLEVGAAVGNRKLKKSNVITSLVDNEGVSLARLYDDLPANNVHYNTSLQLSYFVPFGKNSTVLMRNRFAALIGQNIFENEKYEVGGFSLLRGFDEAVFRSSFYNVSTLEYRLLLSKNSFFHTFMDVGVMEDPSPDSEDVVVPFGFGTGVALETKGGIFSLTYALGKYPDNQLLFRNGKIHFGYINLF